MNDTAPARVMAGATDSDSAINQRIFETSLDLILVVDRKGTIIRVSPSSSSILGYEPEELVGKSAKGFVHPDDLEQTRQEMRLARSGRVTRNFELRYIARDGSAVPLLWTGVWVEEEQRHFFIGRDMTHRLKLEQQLRQAQKMEAIGRLTGGIAHDFNNILAVIIGMTEVLAEEVADDPELSEMVEAIDEAAERGAQLTNRMLAFARQQPLNPRPVDLNETVRLSSAILRRTLGDDIAVSTVLADDLWPVTADPSQIADVILNLAVNARDAMPNGGRLTIETENAVLDEDYAAQNAEVIPGEYASLVISDSGTGMSREVAERAFDPFFTTKDTGHGTGLGLSMVHGFVKQSQGHVRIYSELGHGTSIKIYLPRIPSDAVHAAAAPAKGREEVQTGTETILVVEDAASVRSMAMTILSGLGYRVLEAEDGKSALEVLDQHPEIDLLFTDLVMPNGMSGQDLLVEARQRQPGLKALFTSGYSREFVTAAGSAVEDVPLLRKPYRKKDIAALVRTVLDGGSS